MHQHLSHKTFRTGMILAIVLALTGLVLYLTGAIVGEDWVMPWYTLPTYIKTPLFLEYFQIDGQPFGVNIDQVITWQHYGTGASYQELPWLNPVLFGALFITLIAISVTLTYFNRFWYLLCTGFMLFVLMQLNVSILGVLPDLVTYIVLLIFGGTTYYFQSINRHLSLFTRSITITVAYTAFAIIIGQLAPVSSPVDTVMAFGLFTPLMLVAVFMVFVGGDNIYSLFNITTKNAPNGKNGLIHFMSIGLVYIIVLILLFLSKAGVMEFRLFLIDSYLIFAVAIVSGYYCLSAKIAVVETAMPEVIIKKWLYPAMVGLSLVVVGYAELSGNDALSDAIQMSILITQLAGAAVFYVYTFINFTPALLTNESVAGVFFKGERAPLLTARILHLIAIVGIFFYLGKQPLFQTKAARYTALGAMAQSIDNDVLASQYYKQAEFFNYYNFKANYALAMLAKKDNNNAEVIKRLTNASYFEKEGKARVALANYFSDKNQLFRKLITLQESAATNDRILNNLGLAHFEFQQYDSAFIQFSQTKATPDVTEGNLRALDYYTLSDPSLGLPTNEETSDNLIIAMNMQAIANKLQLPFGTPMPLAKDTILTQESLFLLFNQSLNFVNPNSEEVFSAIDYYLSNPRNSDLRDFLLLGRALRQYRDGSVNKAFLDLNQLSALYPSNRGLYTYLMALWVARHGADTDALLYLEDAASSNYPPETVAQLKQAIESEAVPLVPHTANWDTSLLANKTKEEKVAALKVLAIKNSFNVPQTLKAIDMLIAEEVPASELYELLRQGLSVNRFDLALTKAYAIQALESGLVAFGRSALEELESYVEPALLEAALKEFGEREEAWRNRPFEEAQ